jgi:hypothetical protein
MHKDENCMYETVCNRPTCYDNNTYNMNCSCGFDDDVYDNVFPENPMYGQSYVPVQTLNETYMPNCGLDKGTIFPELVSPYCPGWSMAEMQYLMDTNEIKEGCNR